MAMKYYIFKFFVKNIISRHLKKKIGHNLVYIRPCFAYIYYYILFTLIRTVLPIKNIEKIDDYQISVWSFTLKFSSIIKQ